MFQKIRASLASFIQPGVRPVTLIAAPTPAAPVVAGPGSLVAGNPEDLAETIRAMGVLRRASPSVRAQAVAARPAATRPAPNARTAAPVAAAPVPSPAPAPADPVSDVIEQLQSCLEMLKGLLPVDEQADDAGDEAGAIAALSVGNKALALRKFDARITALGLKVAKMNASKGLRGQPSSRSRASALVRSGFSGQAQVQKIEACLRPGQRPAASAPAVPPPAPAAASFGYRERVQAIRAEREALDVQMRKSGIFDAKSLARQGQLKAEHDRLIAANRPHRQ